MTAATQFRNTQQLDGYPIPLKVELPMAASTKIYAGTIVSTDASGNAIPASTATTQHAVGRARKDTDNSAGIAGALTVEVDVGVFKFANSTAGDAIAAADKFKPCYLVDDSTVAKTDGSTTRSIAGIVWRVDTDGVFVLILPFIGALLQDALQPLGLQTGTATLVTGTKTVSTATISASSKVFVTRSAQGGTLTNTVEYEVATITPGGPGSFVLNATKNDGTVNTADTSTLEWLVVG